MESKYLTRLENRKMELENAYWQGLGLFKQDPRFIEPLWSYATLLQEYKNESDNIGKMIEKIINEDLKKEEE